MFSLKKVSIFILNFVLAMVAPRTVVSVFFSVGGAWAMRVLSESGTSVFCVKVCFI